MKPTSYIIVITCTLLPINCKIDCETSLSDFKTILKDRIFMDKTLLIRKLFRGPAVKMVRAPPRFGKTVIIDMIHRFLDLNVNSDGEPYPNVTETENYKLFRENTLKIYTGFKKFFNETIGKYPVVRVDYKHLGEIRDFDDTLTQLRQILKTTFARHEYLVRNSSLWLTNADKQLFIKYCSQAGSLMLTKPEIKTGLTFLADSLYRHFGRKIYVLIDDCDAVAHSLLFKDSPQTSEIISFVLSMNRALLTSSNIIRGAYLTGVIRVTTDSLSGPDYFIKDYKFLGNHQFSEYFGATQNEISRIININFRNPYKRNYTKRAVKDFYGGYIIQGKNKTIYSVWSVLKFLATNKTAQSYWCGNENFERYINIYFIDEISEIIKTLILGRTIDLDTSKPFTNSVINGLRNMNKNLNVTDPHSVDWFLMFLYSFGYLSPVGESRNTTSRLVGIKLPNQEIIHELSSVILKICYMKRYDCTTRDIGELRKAIDSFQPQETTEYAFRYLYQTLATVLKKLKLITAEGLQSVIYSFIIEKFPMSKIIRVGRDVVLLIINGQRVAILLGTKKRKWRAAFSAKSIESVRKKLTLDFYKRLFNKSYHDYVDKNYMHVTGKVYIGFFIEEDSTKVSIAYSSSSIPVRPSNNKTSAKIVNSDPQGMILYPNY